MSLENLNFLIVDDDSQLINKLEIDLRSLGFSGDITQAVNGEDAYNKYKELIANSKTIDFVICDVVMPVCDGIGFLEKFRGELDPKKKIPFLLLTSRNDKNIVLQAIKLGVTQYLLKPWNEQVLIQKIVECVGKHK